MTERLSSIVITRSLHPHRVLPSPLQLRASGQHAAFTRAAILPRAPPGRLIRVHIRAVPVLLGAELGLMLRSPPKVGVSNHEAAPSFETLAIARRRTAVNKSA